jgi:adenylosuccinate synthase
MKAFAVIGSSWGDEAKGAAVDKIAWSHDNAVVIRHGGGSQCGHTVKTPDGRRHVFSSFGSGTFVGCPTYLGKDFVLNTKCFVNELHELSNKHVVPQVWVHPDCLVTTPLDVRINRELENRRGKNRHGSVGIGFGETVERSARGYPLRVRDISGDGFIAKTGQILLDWDLMRCAELGLEPIKVGEMWQEFCEEIEEFMDNVNVLSEIPKYEVYIFEGNQGLLLDQERGLEFPYLTRSNTGLQNVIPMCSEIGISKLKVVYMNRPYLTRHGAGPLPGEGLWSLEKDNFDIIDETNVTGEWQGTLRYAPMNKTLLVNAISEDIKDAGNDVKIDYYSGYSCLDQVVKLGSTCDLGIEPALYGFGPSRDKYEVESKFIGG